MPGEVIVCLPNNAGWPVEPLADLCTVISRGSAPVYVDRSDILAIGQRCVTAGGFERSLARAHSSRATKGLLLAEAGDVLLNSTGTGTIGRSCVFDAGGTFIIDGHVTVLRPAPGKADGRWLNALLRTPWGQTFLETHRRDPRHHRRRHPQDRADHREAEAGQAGPAPRPPHPRHRRKRRAARPHAPSRAVQGFGAGADSEGVECGPRARTLFINHEGNDSVTKGLPHGRAHGPVSPSRQSDFVRFTGSVARSAVH